MTTCDDLANLVTSVSLIETCDVTRDGSLRISTPFRYPDGSQIDLFIGPNRHSPLGLPYVLSDKGQTTANLLDLNVKPWATKKRKQAVADICETLGVELDGGQLAISFSEVNFPELSSFIVRLAQACIRVSDLAFTQRLRALNSFKEDVEEFFESNTLTYQSPVIIPGRFDADVEIDFRVVGQSLSFLVQTVSTGNEWAAHGIINEVFRRWYALPEDVRAREMLITIYDSGQNFYREDDLAVLNEQSVVFGFPAQSEQIAGALAA